MHLIYYFTASTSGQDFYGPVPTSYPSSSSGFGFDLIGPGANELVQCSGLGALVSTTFAEQGCNVAINYFNRDEPAQKVQQECEKHGVKAVLVKAVSPALNCSSFLTSHFLLPLVVR